MSNPIEAVPNPDDAKVPQAVEDTVMYYPGTSNVDWEKTVAAAFAYRQGQEPGDKLDGHAHTMAATLNAEVASGQITADQARQSASEMGLEGYVVGLE